MFVHPFQDKVIQISGVSELIVYFITLAYLGVADAVHAPAAHTLASPPGPSHRTFAPGDSLQPLCLWCRATPD